ncbi:helix-turn-helix transcriptional regulator [Martelella lutilitoris]|uniref:Helix-turn-helix transcriptional regulator n=1 Tax=Martelella lutilitoris TaxID=2583532 RepID=A0A7T7HHK0_9HYPH|nr:helix-turn-helix transcriptional regulator [Martelella lutilitoris]QQM29326.1 helix-turn-helix transcriptional regulator [Martelella lutilitoris]
MKLKQYLTEKNITPEAFAALIGGVSESGVRKWMYGERVPRQEQMIAIADKTDGLVMPNDFFLPEREGDAA